MMFRSSGQLAVARCTHLTAQRLFAHRDAKLFPKPLDEITQTPAHNTIEVIRHLAEFDSRASQNAMNLNLWCKSEVCGERYASE
ncbi:hypothetical protein BC360_30120 [Ensifer sp. LC163]|nr:hypothetical protein BC360_30120 [Ensifer sp. LC163]